jgi:hypothetical protein
MWAEGLFGSGRDTALFSAAVFLYLGATWCAAHRLGTPRFAGAVAAFWLLAIVVLPLPAYFVAGFAL